MWNQVAHGTREYEETVALRSEVLRVPLGLEFSREELCEENDSFHLGLWRDGTLVACVVLKPLSDQRLKMRQLAVRQDRRGEGLGRALVSSSESFARDHGFEEMVLHARETAVEFYEKMGYEAEGERFTEVTIPHVLMRKDLRPKRGGTGTCNPCHGH